MRGGHSDGLGLHCGEGMGVLGMVQEISSQVHVKAKGQAKEKGFLQNLSLPAPLKEIPGTPVK